MSFRHGFVTVVMMRRKDKKTGLFIASVKRFLRFPCVKLARLIFLWLAAIVMFSVGLLLYGGTDLSGTVANIVTAVVAVMGMSLSVAQIVEHDGFSNSEVMALCTEVLSCDRFNEVCRYLEYWRKCPEFMKSGDMQKMELDSLLDMLVRYGVRNGLTETVTVYLSKADMFMLHEFLGMCRVNKPNKDALSHTDYARLKMDRVPSYCKPDE